MTDQEENDTTAQLLQSKTSSFASDTLVSSLGVEEVGDALAKPTMAAASGTVEHTEVE